MYGICKTEFGDIDMIFIHLGDLHLGKTVNDFNMIDDQKYILNTILDIVDERKVDAVLIAGDVYDKPLPSEEAVRLLNYFLSELSLRGCKTFMISGNHDSDERLNFGSSLFEKSNIFITSMFDGKLKSYSMEDEHGKVNIYSLPFVKASWVRHYFPDAQIDNYDDAVKTVLSSQNINFDERNILVAHQFVAGKGSDPERAGSENVSVINVGTVEKIGSDTLNGFDYVALGHIHSPQSVGAENIRYSGSPLKYSLSEINNNKSVPLITLGKKGEMDIELIPLKPKRDMRRIKGNLQILLEKENVSNTEDYIYAVLTDEEPLLGAMDILRQTYPYVMKMEISNSHTKEMSEFDFSKITEDKSFEELIREFYESMYGTSISDEEMELMLKVAGEAGVIDEAD